MSFRHLEVRTHDRVITCSHSNAPHHTLTEEGVAEFHALLDDVEADDDLRALVVTGGAEGVFIAHYEVAELADTAEAAETAPKTAGEVPAPPKSRKLHELNRLCLRLEALRIPTIAAVNGTAGGGGCELALACDFRLLSDGPYRFGLPETNVGIIPGAGGTQRLTRLLGEARSLDLILHGQQVSPNEAHQLGLAHRVFPSESFASEVESFAATLAGRSPIGLAEAKKAIRGAWDRSLEEGLYYEQDCFDRAIHSHDAAGALRAWLNGKRWKWTGK